MVYQRTFNGNGFLKDLKLKKQLKKVLTTIRNYVIIVLESEVINMNNIIEKEEKILGYKKDLKKQVENEIEKFEKEKVYIWKVCGNVDNDYYDN